MFLPLCLQDYSLFRSLQSEMRVVSPFYELFHSRHFDLPKQEKHRCQHFLLTNALWLSEVSKPNT